MTDKLNDSLPDASPEESGASDTSVSQTTDTVKEIGGPKGPDPTRFGDWSVNGRCIDF
ncbi:MAG: DUF1674 domain-containing protein [Alphaproteobacteria bacterium]